MSQVQSSSSSASGNVSAEGRLVFRAVKPLCTSLMDMTTFFILASRGVRDVPVSYSANQYQSSLESLERLLSSYVSGDERVDRVVHGVSECFDYIFFPLSQLLTHTASLPQNIRSTAVESAFTCIHRLLDALHRDAQDGNVLSMVKEESLMGLVTLILKYIPSSSPGPSPSGGAGSVWPEEISLLSVECLGRIFAILLTCVTSRIALYPGLWVYLLGRKFRTLAGYCLSVLLGISAPKRSAPSSSSDSPAISPNFYSSIYKNRPLRISALHAINTCISLYAHEGDGLVRTCLVSFMPGVLSSLYRIISGDSKQGSTLISLAIKVFGNMIAYSLADRTLPLLIAQYRDKHDVHKKLQHLYQISQDIHADQDSQPQQSTAQGKHQDTSESDAELVGGGDIRDDTWLNENVANISKLLIHTFSYRHSTQIHSHHKIINQLIDTANLLLSQCAISLTLTTPLLIEYLILSAEHPAHHISRHAHALLANLNIHRHTHHSSNSSSSSSSHDSSALYASEFSQVLEDNFNRHILSLPRIMRTASTSQQLFLLRLIAGYIRLLSSYAIQSSSVAPAQHEFPDGKGGPDGVGMMRESRWSMMLLSTGNQLLNALISAFKIDDLDIKVLGTERAASILPTFYFYHLKEIDPETPSSVVQDLVPAPAPAQSHLSGQGAQASEREMYYQNKFVYSDDSEVIRALILIPRLIGYYGGSSIRVVLESGMELLKDVDKKPMWKECGVVMNEIILGIADCIRHNHAPLHRLPQGAVDLSTPLLLMDDIHPQLQLLLYTYVDPSKWSLPTSAIHRITPSDTLHRDSGSVQRHHMYANINYEMQHNGIILSICIRGIADICSVYQTNYMDLFKENYLMYIIYPLLDKLSDNNILVSQASLATLSRIATYCQYPHIEAFIIDNADYIVDTISTQLRLFQREHISLRQHMIQQYQTLLQNTQPNSHRSHILTYPHQQQQQSHIQNKLFSSAAVTLPRVLKALLHKTGAGWKMISVLDDVLMSVLNALSEGQIGAEAYFGVSSAADVESSGGGGGIGLGGVSIYSYLEILESVVSCINAMQKDLNVSRVWSSQSEYMDKDRASFVLSKEYYQHSQVATRIQKHWDETMETRWNTMVEEEQMRLLRDERESPSYVPGRAALQWYLQRQAEAQLKQERKLDGVDEDEDAEHASRMRIKAEEEAQEKKSREQEMVLQILYKCKHFLSSHSIHQQYLVLSIISQSIEVLSLVPRHLLPAIANIWPYLSPRFSLAAHSLYFGSASKAARAVPSALLAPSIDPDTVHSKSLAIYHSLHSSSSSSSVESENRNRHKPIFLHTLDVLEQMCRHAASFLTSRFSNDVWPFMQTILTQEQKYTEEIWPYYVNKMEQYEMSSTYQVQLRIVRALTALMSYPHVIQKHTLHILRLLTRYLHKKQPASITDAAILAFVAAYDVDADAVHHVLHSVADIIYLDISSRSVPQRLTALLSPVHQHLLHTFNPPSMLHHQINQMRQSTFSFAASGAVSSSPNLPELPTMLIGPKEYSDAVQIILQRTSIIKETNNSIL